ncbi:membrane protein [Pilimelia terevasa]|uniref:Membrane protein n=1 Tax=Pilimelia terevasa TaxID=53372 RepID=A0A8J3FL38_9ACTN|nr:MMPL family transporter [Pilimelia terevasa]GGK37394.1 membrane protein [Pilimelia terevasa]
MARLLHRLGLACVRHRVLVTALWLGLLLASGVGAATLSGPTVSSFKIPGQESTVALDLMTDRFGDTATAGSAQVVIQAPGDTRVTAPPAAAAVAGIVDRLRRLPGVASATDPLAPQTPTISPDQRAAYSTVTYAAPAREVTAAQRQALRDTVAQARTGGLTVEVRGAVLDTSGAVGGPAEAVGVLVALIVLAVTFGSLLAAGMNLLTAAVGVGIGALGITALSGFTPLQSTTPVLAVMLGLAVGIDYALFIVTRFRHELRAGQPVPDAAALAVGTAGSAVVTAGLTVVIALAGLAVAGIPFLTEMGLAAAATIIISVLVAVTLVPAILGFVGVRALPRRARRIAPGTASAADTGPGFYLRWAHTVTRYRWASLLAAVAVLAVVAVPVLSMRTALNPRPVPGSTEARAAAIIADRFGPGTAGPLLVLVDGAGAAARAAAVREQVAALPGVAVALPPRPAPRGAAAALITVVPVEAADSAATSDLVHALRAQVADTDGARVYVTGTTAVSIDVSQKLREALPVYLALVVGLAFVLLVLVFRSVWVPVVGVLGFLLTIGATLGATTAVFQWGWLADVVDAGATGPLMSLSPIIIVGILFGLAMDYQVFLVARMHEAHAHGAGPRDAIVTGFRQAAPVVVAAATIMFAVFAGFVPDGDAAIKPIGFALATGIAFDAIVVRMVAVPAALALLGARAWRLPRALSWLPVLDVEGAALRRGAATAAREPVTADA